jgi:outer membrane protein TolC
MNLRVFVFVLTGYVGTGALVPSAVAQSSPGPGDSTRQPVAPATLQGAPPTLTYQDAFARAQVNAAQLLGAASDASVAREDVLQAQLARRPSLSFRSEYLGTQGNGVLASGRFVTNDGVHVYRDWAVLHWDLTAAATATASRRAAALEALARARVEVNQRGLAVAVTRAYYSLLAAQRKYATAQQAMDQARRYLQTSQSLERGGEVAHSDVVKAELQYTAQQQGFREAQLAMDQARLELAALMSNTVDVNFAIVDDLAAAPALPEFAEAQNLAARRNPEIRAATSALQAAGLDVTLARQAFLPSLTSDFVYGIEANAFALHSRVAAAPEKGVLPNLGYFFTVSLNVPVFDWGLRSSRVRQAVLRRNQANVELTAAQRDAIKNLQVYYREAQTAREQAESLRHSVDLATESLRLNELRYQAGEATILELVDAQTTLIQTRNAYDDGLVRYRVAIAVLQTLTGSF